MKLLFVLDTLSAGGIQSSAIKLLECCTGSKTLILLRGSVELTIPEDIEVTILQDAVPVGSPATGYWQQLTALRRAILRMKPDVVVSMGFSTNVLVLLALMFSGRNCRVIVGIRNSLKELALTRKRWNILRLLTPRIYRLADLVVTNSMGGSNEITAAGIYSGKVRVIYNGYDFEKIQRLATAEVDHEWFATKRVPVLIAAGRLSVQKNFPLLLETFRLVLAETECHLAIIGKGPEETRLKSLAEHLGIAGKVAFMGHQDNPYRFFAKSDVFVLSSMWEGFPNVVCEAMACGLPVVSTDCPTGPNEIISEGVNGLLVPTDNVPALASAILELLRDEDRRSAMAKKAYESVQKFSIDRMIVDYDTCFKQLTKAI